MKDYKPPAFKTAIYFLKQFFILTSFYALTFKQSKKETIFYRKKTISSYFYFTNFSVFFTFLILMSSFFQIEFIKFWYKIFLSVFFVYEMLVFIVYYSLFKVFSVHPDFQKYDFFIDACQHLFPFLALSLCFYEEKLVFTDEIIIVNAIICIIYGSMACINKYIKGVYPYEIEFYGNYAGVLFIYSPFVFFITTFLINFSINFKNKFFY